MKTLNLLVSLLFLTIGANAQSEWINITDKTNWEDAPDLIIVERDVWFRPEIDMGGSAKAAPLIQIDVTFKNIGLKEIKAAEFEIISFCQSDGSTAQLKRMLVKPYVYRTAVSINEEGSFLYQAAVSELTLPIKQIIRISRIEYGDGSAWKRNRTK